MQARALHGGDVHEDIGTAIGRLDEAVAFGGVEPFHRTEGHRDLPTRKDDTPPPSMRWRGEARPSLSTDPGAGNRYLFAGAGNDSREAGHGRHAGLSTPAMILTPIAAHRLPDHLAALERGLAADWTRRVLQRIAGDGDGRRATGAAAARHHGDACAILRQLGVAVRDGAPSLDVSWNGRAVRGATEAYVLLHEG